MLTLDSTLPIRIAVDFQFGRNREFEERASLIYVLGLTCQMVESICARPNWGACGGECQSFNARKITKGNKDGHLVRGFSWSKREEPRQCVRLEEVSEEIEVAASSRQGRAPSAELAQIYLVGHQPHHPLLAYNRIPQAGLGISILCYCCYLAMGQGQSNEGGPHLTTQQVSHELVRPSPSPKNSN
jgi:hypothetical protein